MTNLNFELMKKKEFRNFFLADIISGFGVGMTTVGANWYMLQQTHSNKYVGLYLTINVLAGFLMSPIAGVLTDKYPRKIVILFTFLGRALPMMLISAYFYLNGFSIGLMYLLSILTGAGWITYMAASRSYVQIILPPELLGTANSFIEVSLQVGMFAAGALSGIILHYTGFMVILIINILVFLIASMLIVTVKKDQVIPAGVENTSSFISGIQYVWRHKLILSVGILSILPLIVTQLFNVSSPDYVSTILKANSVVYGFSDMAYGIGGLISGLIMGSIISRVSNRSIIVLFFSVAAIALFSLFIGDKILLMYFGSLLIGLSNSSLRIVINTILMEQVDKAYMGRATSLWNGTAQFIEIFASTGMGFANDKFGADFGFFIMFVIMIVGAVWSLGVLKKKRDA